MKKKVTINLEECVTGLFKCYRGTRTLEHPMQEDEPDSCKLVGSPIKQSGMLNCPCLELDFHPNLGHNKVFEAQLRIMGCWIAHYVAGLGNCCNAPV